MDVRLVYILSYIYIYKREHILYIYIYMYVCMFVSMSGKPHVR